MRVYENNESWVIEDTLDLELLNEIELIIEKNLDHLYSNKSGYSTKGKNSNQYWLVDSKSGYKIKDSKFYDFEKKI